MQRQIVLHFIIRQMIGANYVGPVPQVLAPSPERRKLVLDMGTGPGYWYTLVMPGSVYRDPDVFALGLSKWLKSSLTFNFWVLI
jgi:hypothetical protein